MKDLDINLPGTHIMITIVSGTNRPGSNTHKVALEYLRMLKEKGVDAGLFSLEGVDLMRHDAAFTRIEEEILAPTTHFIFIAPEYNGSFPGALKMLIDNCSTHTIWFHKKALLTGISTGRAGNLRGMDHLSDILNYLKITVHHNRLPISVVDKLLSATGQIIDKNTLKSISDQLDEFIGWSGLAVEKRA